MFARKFTKRCNVCNGELYFIGTDYTKIKYPVRFPNTMGHTQLSTGAESGKMKLNPCMHNTSAGADGPNRRYATFGNHVPIDRNIKRDRFLTPLYTVDIYHCSNKKCRLTHYIFGGAKIRYTIRGKIIGKGNVKW